MLKKVTLASLVVLASYGIAFAESGGAMSDVDVVSGATGESVDASSTVVSKHHKPAKHIKKCKSKHNHKKAHKHPRKHPRVIREEMYESPAQEAAEDYKNEVAVSTVSSCPSCDHSSITQGPYVGASLGVITHMSRSTTDGPVVTDVNYRNTVSNPRVSYAGVTGAVFAGYAALMKQMYAGLEVYAQNSASLLNHDRALSNTTVAHATMTARSNWIYGASLMPGYLVSDNFLTYLRLGVVSARFNYYSSVTPGAQAGIGFQKALNSNLDIRSEWDYTFYRKVKATGTNDAYYALGYPRTQQFNVSLIYKI